MKTIVSLIFKSHSVRFY